MRVGRRQENPFFEESFSSGRRCLFSFSSTPCVMTYYSRGWRRRFIVLLAVFLVEIVHAATKKGRNSRRKKSVHMPDYLMGVFYIMLACLLPVLVAFCWECVKDPGVRRIFQYYRQKAYVNLSSRIAAARSPKKAKTKRSSKVRNKRRE